jgi:hypothetical protein
MTDMVMFVRIEPEKMAEFWRWLLGTSYIMLEIGP